MGGRTSSKNRCDGCGMYRPLCLCSDIPTFALATRVIVLMHWREQKLTSNSAALICRALTNSEIHLRGQKDSPYDAEPLQRIIYSGQAALLYPSDDAVELNPKTASTFRRPFTLIVPDGNWRQASKVATREKMFSQIPRLKLPDGSPSTYRLRISPHQKNLSTFEAISRALGILEGKNIEKALDLLFLKMVERSLWSRGKLRAEDSITGIPEAAFLASREAGARGSVAGILAGSGV